MSRASEFFERSNATHAAANAAVAERIESLQAGGAKVMFGACVLTRLGLPFEAINGGFAVYVDKAAAQRVADAWNKGKAFDAVKPLSAAEVIVTIKGASDGGQ